MGWVEQLRRAVTFGAAGAILCGASAGAQSVTDKPELTFRQTALVTVNGKSCAEVATSTVDQVNTGDLVCGIGGNTFRTLQSYESAIQSLLSYPAINPAAKSQEDLQDYLANLMLAGRLDGVFQRREDPDDEDPILFFGGSWVLRLTGQAALADQLAVAAADPCDGVGAPPPAPALLRRPAPAEFYFRHNTLVPVRTQDQTLLCGEIDTSLAEPTAPGARDFICKVNNQSFTAIADLDRALRPNTSQQVELFGLWGCAPGGKGSWGNRRESVGFAQLSGTLIAKLGLDRLDAPAAHLSLGSTAPGGPGELARKEYTDVLIATASCTPGADQQAAALADKISAATPAAIYTGGYGEGQAHADLYANARLQQGRALVCQKRFDDADKVWADALDWAKLAGNDAALTAARRDLAVLRRSGNAGALTAEANQSAGDQTAFQRDMANNEVVVLSADGTVSQLPGPTPSGDGDSAGVRAKLLDLISRIERFKAGGDPGQGGAATQAFAQDLVDLYAARPNVRGEASGLTEEDRLLQRAAEQVFGFSSAYAKSFKCGDHYWLGLAMVRVGQDAYAEAAFRNALELGRYALAMESERLGNSANRNDINPSQFRCDAWSGEALVGRAFNPINEGKIVKQIALLRIRAGKPEDALKASLEPRSAYRPTSADQIDWEVSEAEAIAQEALQDYDAALVAWKRAVDFRGKSSGNVRSVRERAFAAALRMGRYEDALGFENAPSIVAGAQNPILLADECLSGMWRVRNGDTNEFSEPWMVPICRGAVSALRTGGREADAQKLISMLRSEGELATSTPSAADLAEDALENAWRAGQAR